MNSYIDQAKQFFAENNYWAAMAFSRVAALEPNATADTIEFAQKTLNKCKQYVDSLSFTQNKIAVYAICKDEIVNVQQWYESVKQADYIIVLDTGSTDGTYERLCNLASSDPKLIVKQHLITPWRFDLARNIALGYIPKDANICVSLDFDEIITAEFYSTLKQNWVQDFYERAIYKYVWLHNADGTPAVEYQYDKIHSRSWIWDYPVHESLFNILTNSSQPAQIQLLKTNKFVVHHYQDTNKNRSNYTDLLLQRKAEYKDDPMGVIYLLRDYLYAKKYTDFIDLVEQTNKDLPDWLDRGTLYKPWVATWLGVCYARIGERATAVSQLKTTILEFPKYRDAYIEYAKLLIDRNDYQNARETLQKCFRLSYRYYDWLEDSVNWAWMPYYLLAVSTYYLGGTKNKMTAITCLLKAMQFNQNIKSLSASLNDILAELSDADL